jgi:uncharacterized protein YkwD
MRSILLCAALGLTLAGCASDPASVYSITNTSTSEAAAAASLISAYRVAKGLSPVTVDARLNDAAMHQARVVAAAGKLDHGNFGDRMGRFGIVGYAAENLSAGQDTVAEAVGSWKASPHHNENLLMPQARRIGLARADAKGGYGRYWALVLGQ